MEYRKNEIQQLLSMSINKLQSLVTTEDITNEVNADTLYDFLSWIVKKTTIKSNNGMLDIPANVLPPSINTQYEYDKLKLID